MNFCSTCGAALTGGARFCSSCGTSLPSLPPNAPGSHDASHLTGPSRWPAPPPPPGVGNPSRRKFWLKIAGATLGGLFLLGLVAPDQKPDTEQASAGRVVTAATQDSTTTTTGASVASTTVAATGCIEVDNVTSCSTRDETISRGRRFARDSELSFVTGFCVMPSDHRAGWWRFYLPFTDNACDDGGDFFAQRATSTGSGSGSGSDAGSGTGDELLTCPSWMEKLAKKPGLFNDGFVRGVDALYDPRMDWDGDGVSCE